MEQTLRSIFSRKPQASPDVENVLGSERELSQRYSSEETSAMLNKLMDALEKQGSGFQLPRYFQALAKSMGWNEINWPCLSVSTAITRFRQHEQLAKLLQDPEFADERRQFHQSPMRFWKPFLVSCVMTNIASGIVGLGLAYARGDQLLARTAISHLAALLIHAKLLKEYTSEHDSIEEVDKIGEYLMDNVNDEDKQALMDRFDKLDSQNSYSVTDMQKLPEHLMGLLNLVATSLVNGGYLESGNK